MKTFLTICTCAMISAGLYGFVDMVGDVKNGTMIRYDHGDEEESLDVSAASAEVALLNDAKLTKKKVTTSSKTDAAKQKKESAPTIKKKSKNKIVKKDEVVMIKKENDVPIAEKFTSDIKVDSVPQTEVIEETFHIDYSEFSRGAPRKHKKIKKSNKE